MRFRLSTLIFALTLAAVALAWLADRRRMLEMNRQLNAECAELFRNQTEVVDITTDDWPLHFAGTMRPARHSLYNAADPEDRQRYRENRPSKLMSGGR
jgi:hypothetical protein